MFFVSIFHLTGLRAYVLLITFFLIIFFPLFATSIRHQEPRNSALPLDLDDDSSSLQSQETYKRKFNAMCIAPKNEDSRMHFNEILFVKFQILPHPYRNHPEIQKNRLPFLLKMIAKRNREQRSQSQPRLQPNRLLMSSILRRPVLSQRQLQQRLWLVIVIVMYKVISRNHLQRFLLQYYHPPHNDLQKKAKVNRLKVVTVATAAVLRLKRKVSSKRRKDRLLHLLTLLHRQAVEILLVLSELVHLLTQLSLLPLQKPHKVRKAKALIALILQ